jgi:peptidoglycan hydrolase-like protein with peptidoglycan-binding domain
LNDAIAAPEENAMIKIRKVAALLALSGVAVLPACSMFGGGDSSRSSRARYSSQGYAAAPNYNTTSQMAPAAQAPELTPDMIRNVQQPLQQDGTYRGRVDGVWGPGTQTAVRTYQQQHNMNATGQLDQDTLAAMNLGAAPNNAQQPSSQRYGNNSAPNYNPPPNGSANPPNPDTTR